METNVRHDNKLQCKDSISSVRNNVSIYLKTLDDTAVSNLTINYSSSEITTRLLVNPGLDTPSIVTSYSAVQISGTTHSRSETKHTVMNIPLLHLEVHMSSCTHTRTCLATRERLQSIDLKSRSLDHSAT